MMLAKSVLLACVVALTGIAADKVPLRAQFFPDASKVAAQSQNQGLCYPPPTNKSAKSPAQNPVCPLHVGNLWYLCGYYGYNDAADACAAYGWRLAYITDENRADLSTIVQGCQGIYDYRAWVAGAYGFPGDPCAYALNYNTYLGIIFNAGTQICSELSVGVVCEEMPQVTSTVVTTITNAIIASGTTTTTTTSVVIKTLYPDSSSSSSSSSSSRCWDPSTSSWSSSCPPSSSSSSCCPCKCPCDSSSSSSSSCKWESSSSSSCCPCDCPRSSSSSSSCPDSSSSSSSCPCPCWDSSSSSSSSSCWDSSSSSSSCPCWDSSSSSSDSSSSCWSSSSSSSSDSCCRCHRCRRNGWNWKNIQLSKDDDWSPKCYGNDCLPVCRARTDGLRILMQRVNAAQAAAECAKYGWYLMDFTYSREEDAIALMQECIPFFPVTYVGSFNGLVSNCTSAQLIDRDPIFGVGVGMPVNPEWCTVDADFYPICQTQCPFARGYGAEIGQLSISLTTTSTTVSYTSPTSTETSTVTCTERVWGRRGHSD